MSGCMCCTKFRENTRLTELHLPARDSNAATYSGFGTALSMENAAGHSIAGDVPDSRLRYGVGRVEAARVAGGAILAIVGGALLAGFVYETSRPPAATAITRFNMCAETALVGRLLVKPVRGSDGIEHRTECHHPC